MNENELGQLGWYRDPKNPGVFYSRTTGATLHKDGKRVLLTPINKDGKVGKPEEVKRANTIGDAAKLLAAKVKK